VDVVRAGNYGRKRKRLSRRTSRKVFSRSASRTRSENVMMAPMRGGIRL